MDGSQIPRAEALVGPSPATLAAELWAVARGVDYVRTHDVRALCDAIAVVRALESGG